jgi:hypothetical protein
VQIVRASATHVAVLAESRCAGPQPFELQVEQYIRQELSQHLHSGVLLLIGDDGNLIGVAAHEETADPYGSGQPVSYLRVVAVALTWQGQLVGSWRVSDYLLSAVINDALETDRLPLVFAYTDVDNARARRLLTRPPFEFVEDPMPERRRREDGSCCDEHVYLERRYVGPLDEGESPG